MSNLSKRLRKLARMDARELSVRGSQRISAFRERTGLTTLTKLPDDDALLRLFAVGKGRANPRSAQELITHFRSRSTPRFFAGFSNRQETIEVLRRRWPAAESEIIGRASRIMEGRYDLLGLRDLSFGQPIDWHLEPISGRRAPLTHWSNIDYLDAELVGDKKIIWELNRHQYFAILGQAYWLTADERYAQTFVSQLDSWMDQNPPKIGINWASSLEVSFRAISWLWAFQFFKDSSSFTAEFFLRALKFLYLHASHLETYLSTYFSPNTHLTGEALGLFYLGALLPEFKEAARWKATGREILLAQLSRHVRPDGVYFEQSSYYHRYTTDFYIHFLLLSQAHGDAGASEVEEKLQALLDHLMYITRPDGTTPFLGDDDGGRLVMLDRRALNDFRATLATGSVLFGRGDYKFVAGEDSEESLWLLGAAGMRTFDSLRIAEPAKLSVAFPEGGYFVLRDSWTPRANYFLIDCGPHGAVNYGHAHADALSFELAAVGRTILVDPGTYTYTGSAGLRDWFRSSAAHNTLTLDGESSSTSDGPFSWANVAECEIVSWISRERFDYFAGKHNGYLRLPHPAGHLRSVLFLKHDYWIMVDSLQTAGHHRADLWFHFNFDATPVIEAQGLCVGVSDLHENGGLDITAFGSQGQWKREDAFVSPGYGDKRAAPVNAFSVQLAGDGEIVTFMLPRTASGNGANVTEVQATGGQAFEISDENRLDVVMIRKGPAGQVVKTKRMASDFNWTWMRFATRHDVLPAQILLLNGTTLSLAGGEIIRRTQQINYVLMTREEDRYRVETDQGISECELPILDFDSN